MRAFSLLLWTACFMSDAPTLVHAANEIPANAQPATQNTMATIMKHMTPQQQAQIQKMAEQMSAQIQKQTDGDSDKAQKLLQQYMANPALFYQQMSPEHKNQVEQMTKDVVQKVKPSEVSQ